jgi:hypothetical protein
MRNHGLWNALNLSVASYTNNFLLLGQAARQKGHGSHRLNPVLHSSSLWWLDGELVTQTYLCFMMNSTFQCGAYHHVHCTILKYHIDSINIRYYFISRDILQLKRVLNKKSNHINMYYTSYIFKRQCCGSGLSSCRIWPTFFPDFGSRI